MTVGDVLVRARLLANLGRYDEADPLLAQALAEEPDNEDALSLMTRGLIARHRFAEAEQVCGRQLGAHPESLRGLLAMARIKILVGRPSDGVPFGRHALALDPQDAGCMLALAEVLIHVSSGSAEAWELIQLAAETEPEYVLAHRMAGEFHLGVLQYAEAERWTLQALRIQPDDSSSILQLGLIRAGLGRFEESRDEVLTVLRMDSRPANIDQIIEYVECRAIPDHLAEIYRMMLIARGLPDLSFPGAAGGDPELLAAQGALAYRMYSLQSTDEGRRRAGVLADAVLAEAPGDQNARYIRARTLSDAERHAEALPLAQALHAEGYKDADLALAVAFSGLDDQESALQAVKRLQAAEPDNALFLRVEAHSLRLLKRYDEALQLMLRVAELAPSAPNTQLDLGLAAVGAGDLAVAESAFRKAIEHEPNEGRPHAELALLLVQTDRWAEALEWMAVLRPDMPDVRAMVATVPKLASACLAQAYPALEALSEDDPEPELLDEAAPWIDRALDMYSVSARGFAQGTAAFADLMSGILDNLHLVKAPDDCAFGRVVGRLEGLMDEWRAA